MGFPYTLETFTPYILILDKQNQASPFETNEE